MKVMQRFREWVEELDFKIARSFVGHWFRLEGCGHPRERRGSRFSIELRAGLTTFCAMAYILAVNASIMIDTGGPCECTASDPNACDTDKSFLACKQNFHRDVVTATAAISCLSSVCMGLFANMPVGMAPGMGLNAYFAYQVVGYNGSGRVPYREALLAVFVEGFIFTGLTIIGLRQWLARAIPASLKFATGAGIGLYLTIIGLTPSAGLGVVGHSASDIVGLGGCPPEYLSSDYTCDGHELQSARMWVGIFCGGVFTAVLMMYRFKGAVLAGIALVTIASWPRRSKITMFPHTDSGDSDFNFFKKVVSFRKINSILVAQNWKVTGGQFAVALITFLYVDIMDTTGTLYSMAHYAGLVDQRTQDFEGSAVAYLVDALSISIGSLFGVSPVTAFIESGSGISAGGKTGIVGVVIGICFFISLFFAPIFSSIPVWATGSTLVLVGSLMMKSSALINWSYLGDSIPAFITIALMPLTYSIAYGLIAGIISYMVLNIIIYLIDKASRGKITPGDYDQKEPWTWRVEGGLLPPWVKRLCHGEKRFWEDPSDRKLNENMELEMSHTPSSVTEKKGADDSVTMKEAIREHPPMDEEVGESETIREVRHDTPYAGIDTETDMRI
ncbi:plasma membrane guanine and adenine transmembrane transporter [Schizosaccharomyces osmophilus]|uniref:Plasma membrane guanine and adenine transmembrane transporter n=1 Tax=Schizosaccharomyces osmophilus TaxID=2545709 RepID=A0AAE9W8V0_9SCHI|nr:plasma membrane guanine and adenine transmembrane transporter [Schizosaccharomyces osmophilus]WBW71455.1 plasma membrane guanine and adenine transmembrane transporter [Schizosaccharomyces osmophilus]